MTEKEILRKAKDFILFMDDVIENYQDYYDYEENKTAQEDKMLVQGLLDLYEKEKEKNKELKEMLEHRIKYTSELEKDLFENCNKYVVNKDKIREKIKQYNGYLGTQMYKKYNYAEIIEILQELLEED